MKTTSHELRELNEAGIKTLTWFLSTRSLLESTPEEGRTQYLMPDGKTTIELQKTEAYYTMNIFTTSLIRPKYVRDLTRAIGDNNPSLVANYPNKPSLVSAYEAARNHTDDPTNKCLSELI